MNTQILSCAGCRRGFTFAGARIEQVQIGNLAVRCPGCNAVNELSPSGSDAEGRKLWTVVGQLQSVH